MKLSIAILAVVSASFDSQDTVSLLHVVKHSVNRRVHATRADQKLESALWWKKSCPNDHGKGLCSTTAKASCFVKDGGAVTEDGSKLQCLETDDWKDYECPAEMPDKCTFKTNSLALLSSAAEHMAGLPEDHRAALLTRASQTLVSEQDLDGFGHQDRNVALLARASEAVFSEQDLESSFWKKTKQCPAEHGQGLCPASSKASCYHKGNGAVTHNGTKLQCLTEDNWEEYTCPSELPDKCTFKDGALALLGAAFDDFSALSENHKVALLAHAESLLSRQELESAVSWKRRKHMCPDGHGQGLCSTAAKASCYDKGNGAVTIDGSKLQCLEEDNWEEYTCPAEMPDKCTFQENALALLARASVTPFSKQELESAFWKKNKRCPVGHGQGMCGPNAKASCYDKANDAVTEDGSQLQCLEMDTWKEYDCPSELPDKCKF